MTDFPAIFRDRLETLQVNLGYLCNQSCLHCHVSAGPNRTEEMSRETIELALAYMARSGVRVTAQDRGPGIENTDRALLDNYSSSGTLGLGLPGVKRLMDEFDLHTELGQGTRVSASLWI